jgi:hypothetical protein
MSKAKSKPYTRCDEAATIAAGPGSSQAATTDVRSVSSASHPGKCRRPQASRVTLAKSCCSNNSYGDGLAHRFGLHVGLPDVLKLFERSVQSVTHRRNRLRSERSRLHQGMNLHGRQPSAERAMVVKNN